MILYAFVSREHLQACRTSGIAHGKIPYTVVLKDRGKTRELKTWDHFQWLTNNRNFIHQNSKEGPWKTAVLQGRRQEFRLKLRIPRYGRGRLRKWWDFACSRDVPLRHHINLDLLGKPEEWWIYAGIIPACWIIDISRNPVYHDATFDKVVERQPIPMNTTGGRGDQKWDPHNNSGTHKW
jgi:hypothetical protein